MRGAVVESLTIVLVLMAFAWSQLMPPIPLPQSWRSHGGGAEWASGRPWPAPQHGSRLHWHDDARAIEWR